MRNCESDESSEVGNKSASQRRRNVQIVPEFDEQCNYMYFTASLS